ncbi:MAG: hypothetical protein JW940_08700 [Polyangiaceae bacterium]|nr:hypothetical protein [Polyangiaceae bacterium]
MADSRGSAGTDSDAGTGTTSSGGASNTGGDPATGGSTTGGSIATGGGGGDAGAHPQPPLEPAEGQRLLFERAHSNFAWGPQHVQSNGRFVTADGNVYEYSTPVQEDGTFGDLLRRKDRMTEQQVSAKYGSSPELVATVSESELLAMFALVAEARTGALFEAYCGNDAGVDEYVAWLYDPSTSLYGPVLVGAEGDTCVVNSNPAAATIMDWLCTLTGGMRCGYAHGTRDVPSCDGCTDSDICVMMPDGKSHCSSAGCPPENCQATFSCGTIPNAEATCDCAGAEICSGGRAWCKQLGQEEFTCEAP